MMTAVLIFIFLLGMSLSAFFSGSETGFYRAARIRLVNARGEEVVPTGHPTALTETAQEGDVRFQKRRFAYVNGSFEIDPRWLPLRYQVIKGYEYTIAEGEITPAAVRGGSFTIPLKRWLAPTAMCISITFRRRHAAWRWKPRT